MALHATKLLLGLCTFGLLIAQSRAVEKLPSIQPSYEVPYGGAYEGLSDPRWKWGDEMKRIDRSFEWKIAIKFFGKVIDQDNQPVAGALVRYGWNDIEGSHELYTESDSHGRIVIEGLSGKILSVDVSKDGYHLSKACPHSFEYAAFFESDYYFPDAANPVIFRLVKKLGTEPLIAHHVSQRVPYETECFFDPQQGTISQTVPPNGGLKFSFERSETPQGTPFDWKWTIESVNGGLQEIKEEFAQVAPGEGYGNSWQIAEKAIAQPFRRNAQVRLFLRSSDHRYSRVDVDLVHPNLRKGGPRITIDSFLNPSGSRNLEFDPSKQINRR